MDINFLLSKVNQVLEDIALINYKLTSLYSIYQVSYMSANETKLKEFYIEASQFELILDSMCYGIPEFITQNEFESIYNLYFLMASITDEEYNSKLQSLQLQDVLN